jgi:5-formaminoimidazole-4-carboxamide-1-beta-D-ribofuranosyl 5'-monophosphate synthetase
VPTIGHLKSDHKLIKQFCEHPIAPISIDKVRVRVAILKRSLQQLSGGSPTEKFENEVANFFRWLTQSALDNQRLLETSRLHFPRKTSKSQPADRPRRAKVKNAKKAEKGATGANARKRKSSISKQLKMN